MVLPIVIGLGATVLALAAKTTISALRKYQYLTPEMIAALNNIKVKKATHLDPSHPHFTLHEQIRQKYLNEGFKARMTEQEALQIMGIEGNDIINLNSKMVKERYRKLMVMNHPDKHGSQYLTQKINEAKAVLDKSVLVKK